MNIEKQKIPLDAKSPTWGGKEDCHESVWNSSPKNDKGWLTKIIRNKGKVTYFFVITSSKWTCQWRISTCQMQQKKEEAY
jgi:hypothetical protein